MVLLQQTLTLLNVAVAVFAEAVSEVTSTCCTLSSPWGPCCWNSVCQTHCCTLCHQVCVCLCVSVSDSLLHPLPSGVSVFVCVNVSDSLLHLLPSGVCLSLCVSVCQCVRLLVAPSACRCVCVRACMRLSLKTTKHTQTTATTQNIVIIKCTCQNSSHIIIHANAFSVQIFKIHPCTNIMTSAHYSTIRFTPLGFGWRFVWLVALVLCVASVRLEMTQNSEWEGEM